MCQRVSGQAANSFVVPTTQLLREPYLHEPVHVKVLMEHVGLAADSIQVVVDRLVSCQG